MNCRNSMLLSLLAALAGMTGTASAERQEIDRTEGITGGTVTSSSQISSMESGIKLFDGTPDTKWLATSIPATVTLDFNAEESYVVSKYKIYSANDAHERDPKDWELSGSNDGTSWKVIHRMTGYPQFQDFKTAYEFDAIDPNGVQNATAYKMYKFNVTANDSTPNATNLMQISELELLQPDGTRVPSVPMFIRVNDQINEGEGFMKAFDNTVDTKWLSRTTNGLYIDIKYTDGIGYPISGYRIASCNDAHDRDPRAWRLRAALVDNPDVNNPDHWKILDSRSDETWPDYKQLRFFEFNNMTSYKHYRFEVTQNNGSGNLTGMSEFQLLQIIDDPKVIDITPTSNATVKNDVATLTWDTSRATDSAVFDVYFGTNRSAMTQIADDIDVKSVDIPVALAEDTRYYWRVDIIDNPFGTGTQPFTGEVNAFRNYTSTEKVLEWSMESLGASTVYDYEFPVEGVTVKASSIEGDGRAADKTLGVGFFMDKSREDPNGLKHTYWPWDSWISHPDQEGTTWIQYNFTEPTALGTMHIWNHNCAKEWYDVENNRGMKNVVVYYGTELEEDPNWIEYGRYLIPIGSGEDGAAPSIGIPFNGQVATAVRIAAAETDSNWGAAGNMHALAEVRFGKYGQPMTSYAITDTSGKGNDGYTYNAPEINTEQTIPGLGNGLKLNGGGSVNLDVAGNTLPLGPDANCNNFWTMNFYLLLPEAAENYSFFVGFGGFDTGAGRFIAQLDDGRIRFWGSGVDVTTTTEFDLNRWQMITATYESGVLKLYKNAELIGQGEITLNLAPADVAVGGTTPWGESVIPGTVDEFTLYRGALPLAEIEALAAKLPTQYNALNPEPVIGATNVVRDPLLSWDAPLSSLDPTFDVYLGTSEESMTLIASNLATPEYDLVGSGLTLAYDTTYYWHVVTTPGDDSATWSFTTMPETLAAAEALVWDFETIGAFNHTYQQDIKDITATASSFEHASTWREPFKAVNGNYGIAIDHSVAGIEGITHQIEATLGWCSEPGAEGKPWIRFAFDQSYKLGVMHVWNHTVSTTWASEVDRGMRDVVIKYTNDDAVGTAVDYDPNAWTNFGSYTIPVGVSLASPARMPASIGINFNGTNAKYVVIEAVGPNSNWGNTTNMHGLAEVRFGIHNTVATSPYVTDTNATASGNANGIMSGTPEIVTGLAGGHAIELESTGTFGSDFVTAKIVDPALLPLSASSPWSMNMFINLPTNPASPTVIAGFGGQAVGGGRFFGRWANGVHFWGGDNTDVQSFTQYTYGKWQMVTAVFDGTTLTMYRNGEVVSTATPTLIDAAPAVTIAGILRWNLVNATVDDFSIYSGVLSRTEIADMLAKLPMDGDLDLSGIVDVADLGEFVEEWLATNDNTNPADFTGDANVDLLDFAVLAENWLMSEMPQ
ncbi:MAG: discoidin domain-containing protein [Sedimentisphaerales bacterium]|nr:discoidin domain-containing protein [Sedimentisphaerales bacterium]MBN2843549.1 discoidin domain-containing protein [Sedimentisphaerales bacterium]